MKKFIFIVLNFFLLLTPVIAQDEQDIIRINIDNPYEYLPEYLNNIYLGISFNDFTNIKDTLFFRK